MFKVIGILLIAQSILSEETNLSTNDVAKEIAPGLPIQDEIVKDSPSNVTEKPTSSEQYQQDFIIEYKKVAAQHPFIRGHGINLLSILQALPISLEPYKKYLLGTVLSTKIGVSFNVSSIRAGNWCFLEFTNTNHYRFFFDCNERISEKEIFVKEVSPDCPFPESTEIKLPIEEICYMHYKESEEMVQNFINFYGEGDAETILNCYIEIVKSKKDPNVETLCSKESLLLNYERLTDKKLAEIQQRASLIENSNGQQKYEGKVNKEVNKVNAK